MHKQSYLLAIASRCLKNQRINHFSIQTTDSVASNSQHIISETTPSDENLHTPTIVKRNLWRVDKFNKFQVTPQAWVSNFDTVEEKRVGLIDLHPDVFRTFPRLDILAQNLRWQNVYRDVTFIKMLNKAELPGTGKKPWPQKGMGRARHGHIRSPLWKGGGIIRGIRGPKTWFYMLPDSKRIKGLAIALTIKHAQDDLFVVDDLDSLPSDNPDLMEEMAFERNWGYSVLFVHDTDVAPRNLVLAIEEKPGFSIMPYYGLNCLSMIKYDTVVISRKALETVEKRLLEQMHRLNNLSIPFNYKDHKIALINEGEHENDDKIPPFV